MIKSRTRRLIGGATAVALTVAIAGCTSGGDAAPAKSGGGEASLQGASDETYTMVTFLSGLEFWKECYRGFQDAAKLLGVSTNFAGTTEYDVNLAISEFEQVIATQPDGIAVTAMNQDAYVAPIKQAIDSGIPTVTFDSDSPQSDRLSFLGTGNYNAGAVAARELGALYPDEEIEIGIVTILGSDNVKDRLDGFNETIAAEFPNLKVVQTADSGADEGTAASATANLLQANPGVDVIFATLTLAEVGALQALSEAGVQDKVEIITFDAEQVTLESIRDGDVAFSIAQGPYNMGYWSMMMLYAAKHKIVEPVKDWSDYGIAPLPPVVDTGAFLINGDNVEAYLKSAVR